MRVLIDDDVKVINRAAAVLDGVLYLPPFEQSAIARRLFEIAGNPMSEAAARESAAKAGA